MLPTRTKILFIITKSNLGGAQRYVFDLVTALPTNIFDTIVALGGTGTAGADAGLLAKKLAVANIRTVFIHSFMRDISLLHEFSVLKELVQLLRVEKPDVVHLNSSKAGGLGALVARIIGIKKIIFTSHGLAHDEDRGIFARTATWLATWATFLLSHTIITISKDNYDRARQFPFCAKKIVLIHNGLKKLEFKSRDDAQTALSPYIQDRPTCKWIGTIAELTWNKGLHHLIRAVSILKHGGVDVALYIIGEGDERIFLETLIDEEGVSEQVHLLGFIPEAYKYLTAFDVFILTSVKEGLPYVLIEAGQAGIAIIASDIAGVSDIVEDGVSGFLVPPKEPKHIAKALEKLLTNTELRKTFSTAIQQKVYTKFSIEKMVHETSVLYK